MGDTITDFDTSVNKLPLIDQVIIKQETNIFLLVHKGEDSNKRGNNRVAFMPVYTYLYKIGTRNRYLSS